MVLAADMSRRSGWLSDSDIARITKLITRAKLPVRPPPDLVPAKFRELMAVDKKVQDGKLRLVLLRAIGETVVTSDFSDQALDATLKHAVAEA